MAGHGRPFFVSSPDRYGKDSENLTCPEEIGSYSVNGEMQFVSNPTQVKYLVLPRTMHEINWDLNRGFEVSTLRGLQETRRMDHLLRWILRNKEEKRRLQKSKRCTFVFNRGTLGKIMCTAHSPEDWLICVTRYKSAIYLAHFSTEKYLKTERSYQEELQYFWGSKFEQYATSGTKGGFPDTNSPVNQHEQFYVVLQSVFGIRPLLYSAEIDAFDPAGCLNSRYVELKTSKITPDLWVHRNKLLHWYIQCRLTGLQKLLCGFRDENGTVKRLKWIPVSEMRKLSGGFYDPKDLFGLGNRFLQFVEKVVVKDDPKVVYKFFYDPETVDDRGRRRITWQEVYDPPDHIVLPEWYIAEL